MKKYIALLCLCLAPFASADTIYKFNFTSNEVGKSIEGSGWFTVEDTPSLGYGYLITGGSANIVGTWGSDAVGAVYGPAGLGTGSYNVGTGGWSWFGGLNSYFLYIYPTTNAPTLWVDQQYSYAIQASTPRISINVWDCCNTSAGINLSTTAAPEIDGKLLPQALMLLLGGSLLARRKSKISPRVELKHI